MTETKIKRARDAESEPSAPAAKRAKLEPSSEARELESEPAAMRLQLVESRELLDALERSPKHTLLVHIYRRAEDGAHARRATLLNALRVRDVGDPRSQSQSQPLLALFSQQHQRPSDAELHKAIAQRISRAGLEFDCLSHTTQLVRSLLGLSTIAVVMDDVLAREAGGSSLSSSAARPERRFAALLADVFPALLQHQQQQQQQRAGSSAGAVTVKQEHPSAASALVPLSAAAASEAWPRLLLLRQGAQTLCRDHPWLRQPEHHAEPDQNGLSALTEVLPGFLYLSGLPCALAPLVCAAGISHVVSANKTEKPSGPAGACLSDRRSAYLLVAVLSVAS
jgi:hypothetical protein